MAKLTEDARNFFRAQAAFGDCVYTIEQMTNTDFDEDEVRAIREKVLEKCGSGGFSFVDLGNARYGNDDGRAFSDSVVASAMDVCGDRLSGRITDIARETLQKDVEDGYAHEDMSFDEQAVSNEEVIVMDELRRSAHDYMGMHVECFDKMLSSGELWFNGAGLDGTDARQLPIFESQMYERDSQGRLSPVMMHVKLSGAGEIESPEAGPACFEQLRKCDCFTYLSSGEKVEFKAEPAMQQPAAQPKQAQGGSKCAFSLSGLQDFGGSGSEKQSSCAYGF